MASVVVVTTMQLPPSTMLFLTVNVAGSVWERRILFHSGTAAVDHGSAFTASSLQQYHPSHMWVAMLATARTLLMVLMLLDTAARLALLLAARLHTWHCRITAGAAVGTVTSLPASISGYRTANVA